MEFHQHRLRLEGGWWRGTILIVDYNNGWAESTLATIKVRPGHKKPLTLEYGDKEITSDLMHRNIELEIQLLENFISNYQTPQETGR